MATHGSLSMYAMLSTCMKTPPNAARVSRWFLWMLEHIIRESRRTQLACWRLGPYRDTLAAVLLLLDPEALLIEMALQTLVAEVDTQLLETVVFEDLEAEDV